MFFLTRFLNLEDNLNLSAKWFYVSICVTFISQLVQFICNRILTKNLYTFKLLIYTFYTALFVIDNTAFILSVKEQPSRFQSFEISVLTPVIIMITTIISLILYARLAFQANTVIKGIYNFIPGMFWAILIKVSYALCYFSASGLILIMVDLMLTILKVTFIPNTYHIMKHKID